MKLGDYVRIRRANRTYIRKIISIYEQRKNEKLLILDKSFEGCRYSVRENKVLKSSPNIIDLIEVGDYVNGYYVEDVLSTFINVATGSNYFQSPTIYEKDIKSIVTKEQFESMKYKIESKE